MPSNTVKVENKKKTQMVAHRGASGLERENTCAAFVAAGNRSYFGIETDLYVTKDGKYAIGHDPSLLRCGGVDLKMQDSTLDELRAVTLFDIDGQSRRADLVVPELWEYISICKKYEKVAVLELKSAFSVEQTREFIDIIKGYEYLDKVIFISFVPEDLLHVRTVCPEATCQLLPPKNDPEWIFKFCLENRIDLDAADAERMIEIGVDFITSNRLE